MKKRFENQVAVISGGADGLGLAIAKRLASEGCSIALFDVNPSKLDTALQALAPSQPHPHLGYCVDVSDETQVAQAFDDVIKTYSKVDVMVNSAGIVGLTATSILDYPTADFDKVYQVNLRGSFLMSKYALREMKKNHYGRVLLLASIAGKDGNPFMVGYTASKSGVIGLVKGLAKEFATDGIAVNGLAPAVIQTAMNANTAPEQLEYMINKIPMKRLGTADEVAAMSSFIVSNENSFSTGFIYDISGGRATF